MSPLSPELTPNEETARHLALKALEAANAALPTAITHDPQKFGTYVGTLYRTILRVVKTAG